VVDVRYEFFIYGDYFVKIDKAVARKWLAHMGLRLRSAAGPGALNHMFIELVTEWIV